VKGVDETWQQRGIRPDPFRHHYRGKHAIVHGAGADADFPWQPGLTQGRVHLLFTGYPAYGRQNWAVGRRLITGRAVKMAKIILAEDDSDMRRFLVKALQSAGYEVIPFDNGLSAYERLREEPFELLLTDIVMPEMDGIELARRASELDPDIKIMFITGFAAVALNSDAATAKNAKVLSKPVHLRELVNEVHKLLAA
jgi:two-component system cell cycle response regulator CpdR